MGKYTELRDKLTIEEKAALIHASTFFNSGYVERLGIPELKMNDGPNGVRQEFEPARWMPIGDTADLVTWMPSNTCLASTWSKELAEKFGEVLGEEARGRGKDVILAPGINIKRTPLCGRNFEYMSEDPVLSGDIAVPLIKGIQKNDVAACVKHFALNNQELERLLVEAKVDEKTLQELYLPAFKKACVDGDSYSIMGAYNRANGEYCCNNKHLLVDILRDMWNYKGVVVSDWGGVQETEATIDHGVDIEMSIFDAFDDYFLANPVIKLVKEGKVSEEKLNERVDRILALIEKLHIGEPYHKQGSFNTHEHQNIIEEVAEEGIVLLKNDKNHLPISPVREDGSRKKVLVVGDNATRNNGLGGGSSEIKMLYTITPMLGLNMTRGGDVEYKWLPGYYLDNEDELSVNDAWQESSLETQDQVNSGEKEGDYADLVREMVMYAPEETRDEAAIKKDFDERIKPNRDAYKKAVLDAIPDYDEVIFIGGLNHAFDVEGYDKKSITLPYAQDELIEAMADKAGDKLTVVLMCGSAVEMPWIDKVHSLLQLSYAGQNGGLALARVIYGDVNPSGKLPETYPICLADTPTEKYDSYPGEIGPEGHRVCEYKEKLMVGYRYYETKKVPVRFPFGYGLSYTTFDVDRCAASVEGGLGDGLEIKVSGVLTNTGSRAGKEVLQLYIGSPESDQPVKLLKAFTKVAAQPGEQVLFELSIGESDLGTFDVDKNAFSTKPGTYKLYLGTSVKDIAFETEVSL